MPILLERSDTIVVVDVEMTASTRYDGCSGLDGALPIVLLAVHAAIVLLNIPIKRDAALSAEQAACMEMRVTNSNKLPCAQWLSTRRAWF